VNPGAFICGEYMQRVPQECNDSAVGITRASRATGGISMAEGAGGYRAHKDSQGALGSVAGGAYAT